MSSGQIGKFIEQVKREFSMKTSIMFTLVFSLLAVPALAQEPGVIYQTYPGTTYPNYAKPAMKSIGGMLYSTYPGTTAADLSKPMYASPPPPRGAPEQEINNQIEWVIRQGR